MKRARLPATPARRVIGVQRPSRLHAQRTHTTQKRPSTMSKPARDVRNARAPGGARVRQALRIARAQRTSSWPRPSSPATEQNASRGAAHARSAARVTQRATLSGSTHFRWTRAIFDEVRTRLTCAAAPTRRPTALARVRAHGRLRAAAGAPTSPRCVHLHSLASSACSAPRSTTSTWSPHLLPRRIVSRAIKLCLPTHPQSSS